MKKPGLHFGWMLSALITINLLFGSAFQQISRLQLSLIRNFGYGGLGRIQGSFTIKISNPPEELKEVDFYLDGELILNDQEPPFELKFHTGDYRDGNHVFSAVGYLADQSSIDSNQISKEFLSSEQAWSETQNILVPLLVGVALVSILGISLPLLLNRKMKFNPGSYGPAGGAVCARCQLPFSRPFLAPNLAVGKLVRCPHCGKLSILPRAGKASLEEAESRYHNQDIKSYSPSNDKDFKDLLEESRFED